MDASQLDVVFNVFNNRDKGRSKEVRGCSSSGSSAESEEPRGRLPRWLSGRESPRQCRRCGFHPKVGKIPWRKVAAHSSVLAWKIPWMEEPGGLQSVGCQGVGHDWVSTLVGPEPRAHRRTKGQIIHLGIIWSEWGEGYFSQRNQGKEGGSWRQSACYIRITCYRSSGVWS